MRFGTKLLKCCLNALNSNQVTHVFKIIIYFILQKIRTFCKQVWNIFMQTYQQDCIYNRLPKTSLSSSRASFFDTDPRANDREKIEPRTSQCDRKKRMCVKRERERESVRLKVTVFLCISDRTQKEFD